MKHMIGKSQTGKSRFIKDKSCSKNLIVFYHKVTCSADVGQVVLFIDLGFCKAFNSLSHSLLLEKLMCYSLEKRLGGGWGTG